MDRDRTSEGQAVSEGEGCREESPMPHLSRAISLTPVLRAAACHSRPSRREEGEPWKKKVGRPVGWPYCFQPRDRPSERWKISSWGRGEGELGRVLVSGV